MQVATPSHHAFVGQLRLKSVMRQSPGTSRIVAFDTKHSCVFDIRRSKRLVYESDSHLPFKQHCFPCDKQWLNSFHPLESHCTLPGSSGLMVVTEGPHDLRRRHADCIETKNRDRRM